MSCKLFCICLGPPFLSIDWERGPVSIYLFYLFYLFIFIFWFYFFWHFILFHFNLFYFILLFWLLHGGPSPLVLSIYLFVCPDTIVSFIDWPVIYFILFTFVVLYYLLFLLFYVFYLFIDFTLWFIFILFMLFYLFIYFILCYLFIYYLFILSVCGAMNVRVWMPRFYYCILNEYECGRDLHLYFLLLRIAHAARAPPGLLYFDNLTVISRGSQTTQLWWYTSPACEPGRYNYCDSPRLGGLPPSL